MDLRQLRYFTAIVRFGSFGKAAEHLYIAQPSLSQQINKLESELGSELLLRSPQGVKPTAAGKLLLKHAQTVLRQIEILRHDVSNNSNSESGTVSIGLPTTVSAMLAAPLFERVRATHPGIHLQFLETMSARLDDLLSNQQLDLAILFRPSRTAGFSVVPLFDEALYLFGKTASEKPSRRRQIAFSDLAEIPLILPSKPNELRILIEKQFSSLNLQPKIVADIDSLPTLLTVTENGEVCTILPASAGVRPASLKNLKMRSIVAPELRRTVSLCWSNTAPVNSAALAVRQLMLQLIGELLQSGQWPGAIAHHSPLPAEENIA